MKEINITSELSRFEIHLENNPRTIFSAKFGDGKTYFLKQYTELHKEDALLITLHPINYSVAQNEDVFEYIKRDILVELSKQPEFRNVNWKAVAESIFNIDTLLEINEKLTETLPEHIGFVPIKPISKLALIPAQIFKKVDDEVSIDRYFESFSEMKGGIFEQDQYTEAIKAIVAKIQENGRKCVLIIEDLDRIDPGHLFRILNVLGAHVDDDVCSNKFGFDNIVAVLDYEVTESVFHHFYGEKANYAGYMAKFAGHNRFNYSITREAVNMLLTYLQSECRLDSNAFDFAWHADRRDGHVMTINDRVKALSVRDVVNVLDEIEKQYNTEPIRLNSYWIDPQVPLVKLLAILVRLDICCDLAKIVEFVHQNRIRYELLGAFLLAEPKVLYKSLRFGDEDIRVEAIDGEGGKTDVKFQMVWGGERENHREYTSSIVMRVIDNVHDFQLLS